MVNMAAQRARTVSVDDSPDLFSLLLRALPDARDDEGDGGDDQQQHERPNHRDEVELHDLSGGVAFDADVLGVVEVGLGRELCVLAIGNAPLEEVGHRLVDVFVDG